MATVAFDGLRISNADELSPTSPYAGAWLDSGGQAAVLEAEFVYQGTRSVSEKVKTTELGVGFVPTTATFDFETTKRVALFKIIITTPGTLSDTASTALKCEVGSGGRRANYYQYYIATKTTYPVAGGWLVIPVDPNVAGYRNATPGGTPDLTQVNYWGTVATCTITTAKAENIAMDAIDYIDHGTGLTLTGTSGVFQDFINFDQGTSGNRYGICITKEGILYIAGVLTIGNATLTTFSDSNKILVFPDGRFNTGFCGIDVGLQNASNVVSLSACTLIGRGEYGHDGATADTRPDFEATGTVGSLTIDGCSLQNFNRTILTSTCTLSDSVFIACAKLTQGNATISNCVFDSPAVATGVAFAVVDNPVKVSDCTFNSSGVGHAIELTTPGEYNFSGNVFNNYGADDTNNAAIYNNSVGYVKLNVLNGLKPTVRNGSGASTDAVVSVDLEINGLTEGSRGVMIGSGGAEDGNVLLQGYANNLGKITGTFGGITPQNVSIRARNGGIVNAAILEQSGSGFTDYTNDARDKTGTNDVNLLPASPAVNDAFYFGGLNIFGEIEINVTTVGTTYVLTWEYYNGSGWSSLSVTDSSNSFQNSSWHKIQFTPPGNWTVFTVDSKGPFYYIRARVTSGGGAQPKAEEISLANTIKYYPFEGSGQILSIKGLATTVVWIEDTNNP